MMIPMLGKPPTNLPGTTIRRPDRPNSQKCPDCKKPFQVVIIDKDKDRTECPHCGTKVQVVKKPK
jgi:DNA-directed RNA polymerase subunit RPC12/RpoP